MPYKESEKEKEKVLVEVFLVLASMQSKAS